MEQPAVARAPRAAMSQRRHAAHGAHHTGHAHGPARFGRAFAIGIALNLTFVVVELVYGVLGNSVALVADAGHNLSDVLGLAVAWIASILAKRPPSARFTYGLGGSSILAALFNAVLLLVAVGVTAVHDLHIWSMSTTETALTAHLVLPDGHPGDSFLLRTSTELRRRYGIGHSTLQIELSAQTACQLAPDHIV